MQIKNRQKFLTIVAIIGASVLIGKIVVFEPLLASWAARNAHIADLRKSINKGNQLIGNRNAIEARWTKMKKNTFLGTESQAQGEMIKAFDRWSQASQISISSIKNQSKQTDEEYTTLICRADASGTMETLARFLYEVESDPLALKIESVEVTSHDNDGQQLSLGLQVSGLLLTPKQP